jgi:dTDP-4-amino-4,6-dideoxygalactose transaminase
MIPFIDLKAQWKHLERDIRARMDAVLAHGRFINGPEVAELEEKLAAFAGTKHCVSCSSGTDALLLGLMAAGVGPGDAVFTTPFTFIATAEVVSLLGATPVFVDIDPATFNMDPAALARAVDALLAGDAKAHPLPKDATGLTAKAVLPVDLFGLPADYDAINAVAEKHGMFVLEDAAQGFGGEYKGRRAGSLCQIGATSFFPAKPLGCYGDGGAVFTDDENLAKVMKSLRVHGQGGNKYDNVRVGLNARLDTLQAAILLPKLDAFPAELVARQGGADIYARELGQAVVTPTVPKGLASAWAQYSILVPGHDRDGVIVKLRDAGVPSMIYYPKPLHLQEAYAGLGYSPGDFPASEQASRNILSLPMHPYMEEAQVKMVAAAVKAALE